MVHGQSEHGEAQSWHDKDDTAVLAALETCAEGVLHHEAERRLGLYGRNASPDAKRVHPVIRFLRHLNNPLIYLLLVGAVAAAAGLK